MFQGRDVMKNGIREERRSIARAATSIVLGGTLFGHWIKPVCNSVLLPVHALTSAADEPVLPQLVQPEDPQGTRLALNTPPLGEDVIIDARYSLPVRYSMLSHISDRESPSTELTLVISSLPEEGAIEILGQAEFVYQLKPEYINAHGGSDRFNYRVLDPQGALSAIYQIEIINLPYVEG